MRRGDPSTMGAVLVWWLMSEWGPRGSHRARARPHIPASPPPQLNKRSSSFRKAFEEIAGREALLACFSCAWQREVPYHGRLYVSSGHVCFHASLLLKDIKVGAAAGTWGSRGGSGPDAAPSPQAVVPVTSICALKKTNTALLVPNALSIRTAEGDKVSAGGAGGRSGGGDLRLTQDTATCPPARSSSSCRCASGRPPSSS